LISDLCNLIEEYLEPEQAKKVYRAYLFSSEAHTGQQRLSGEPYIYHPIAVAYILGEMRVDAETLCAALLHDVIEDTGISKERLAYEFDDKVAELVDGVSKLTMMECGSREQAQAATFR
jgi:(p)ppGpp synthase/HD superfamily hydrolase